MKQLILRVPDEIHGRLKARARREGRSMNAVAGELLDASMDADIGDRRARLRLDAARVGVHRRLSAKGIGAARRKRIVDSTRGLGSQLDRYLGEERDRR